MLRNHFFTILSSFVFGLLFCACAEAGPSVFLVRHAEKVDEGKDPDLSKAGESRARALALTLRDVNITHLFCTHLKRTQQTLAPLEKALGKKCLILHAKDQDGLVKELRKLSAKDTAIVAGHSNTLGPIAIALGAKKTEQLHIEHDDYDGLFYLQTSSKGIRSFTKLHVGPANPLPIERDAKP